jgi:hypothetical protein
MTDIHPFELGFICRRKLSSDIKKDTVETLENSTTIEFIGHSSFKPGIKLEVFAGDRAMLSKSDDESTSNNAADSIEIADDAPEESSSDVIDLTQQLQATTSSVFTVDELICIDST